VHFVTRTKVAPDLADAQATQAERQRGAVLAGQLSMSVLSRAWQILLKGVQETRDSPRPLAAADMVLVRLAYAADLPSPEEVLKRLSSPREESANGTTAPRGGSPASGPSGASRGAPRLAAAQPFVAAPEAAAPENAPAVVLKSFAELVALAGTQRDIQIKSALERDVRLVRFEPGLLEFSLAPGGSPTLAAQLTRKLQDWTGQRWMVALSTASGAPSLTEQAQTKENDRRVGVQAHPLVRATLEQFPGAVIVAVRGGEAEPLPRADALMPVETDDVGYIDDSEDEDF
jgi:DNA polymerase-3 subunit gamma/tau